MTTAAAMTRRRHRRAAARRRWCGPRPGRRCPPPRRAHPGHIRAIEPAAALPVRSVPSKGTTSFVDERLLRLAGVAPDEDDDADGEEGRPAEEADERDVQGAGDELHGDQQRDQDGGDRPDAAAVGDGAGVDVGGLPLHRDQQPRHGVDEDHHAAGDGQQDEADAHPHGVDAGLPRDGAADAAEDAVVRAPAQAAQLPPTWWCRCSRCWRQCSSGRTSVRAGHWRPVRRPWLHLFQGGRAPSVRAPARPGRRARWCRLAGAARDGASIGRPPSVSGRVPGSGASAIPR